MGVGDDGDVGFVSLVGAGPGDPGLLTVRGRRAIERADLVLYDFLASPALLAAVQVPGQERICVGKRADASRLPQEHVTELLVRRALSGARVVRLKGGDPFVFGRGGEEIAACVAAGVPFEVVPGVSSAIAAATYAGVAVTHRDLASVLTVATGHERAGAAEPRVSFADVARAGGTVVVLMGVLQAARWSADLQTGGAAPDTPVLLVRWATLPRQQVVETTLAGAAAAITAHALRPPVVAVVGDVVRQRHPWFESRRLAGEVVAITRASHPATGRPFEVLEDHGAHVIHVPVIQQEPVDEGRALVAALAGPAPTDLVLTSTNGVRALARALADADRDTRSLHGVTTWAVGPGTARAMRAHLGLGADHVPSQATGEGLVAHAADVGVAGRRFLFPAAEAARPVVPDGLRALGATVDQVACYRTVPDPLAAARLESAIEQGLSLITLASPSAVDACVAALAILGHGPDRFPVAAIGPTTGDHARAAGCRVAVVAARHTMAGLASAILTATVPRP